MDDYATITRLREQRFAELSELRVLIAKADEEKRSLTPEETQESERRESAISALDADIARRERVAALGRGDVKPEAERASEERGGEKPAEARYVDTPEYRGAFDKFLRGTAGAAELRVLSKASGPAGSNLVPTAFETTIINLLRDTGHMRELATVITTDSGEAMNFPTVTSHGSSAWIAENGSFSPSDDAFGQTAMNAYKNGTMILVSDELLQDSAFDLEAYIAQEFAIRTGIIENTAYVAGNGSSKPTGLFDATAGAPIGVTGATGNTLTVTADTLFDIYHSLLPAFRRNAVWLTNDQTVKGIRKLKDTTNQYLWQPGLAAGTLDTLLGKPLYVDPDVPVMAANARSIAFGDIRAAYTIRDTRGVYVQRLNELYAANGQVGFKAYHRTDGKVLNAQAVRLYQNSAT